jgi:hypothetical protein
MLNSREVLTRESSGLKFQVVKLERPVSGFEPGVYVITRVPAGDWLQNGSLLKEEIVNQLEKNLPGQRDSFELHPVAQNNQAGVILAVRDREK